MAERSIEQRAAFDRIRYAQGWEDADVLLGALAERKGGRFLSIAAAGDNALALLLLDPKEVVAADLSEAQLECLRLRIAAYRELDQGAFLEFIGARDSGRRASLFDAVLARLDEASRAFWNAQRQAVIAHGAGNVGKFEDYFRLFRRWVLPLVHSRRTVRDVFVARAPAARHEFFEARWNTWRWRLMTALFFSKFAMGRLGRDPAFFDHVEGNAAAHVRRKVRFAAVEQDPSHNPHMRAILLGTQDETLPLAWRAESHGIIRDRLDRLTLVKGPVDHAAHGPFDGFNLSDIFEYMTPDQMQAVYQRLLAMAAPHARFVYWNMMVPRRASGPVAERVMRLADLENRLKRLDKAFFYRDLVIEEARAL
jgi:S-adenosylmethionine-diacylglycerol 3-amino-3-carboxypropyl transferase